MLQVCGDKNANLYFPCTLNIPLRHPSIHTLYDMFLCDSHLLHIRPKSCNCNPTRSAFSITPKDWICYSIISFCYDIPICTFPYSHVTLTHIPKSHSFIPLLYCSHCHAEHHSSSIYIPILHTSFSLFKPSSYLQRQFNGRICAEGGGGRRRKAGREKRDLATTRPCN